MDENPYRSPVSHKTATPATKRSKSGFTLVELAVVVGIIIVLIALLLPAVRTSGEAGRRDRCKYNLRQIGLALQAYHETYHVFPPAHTVDPQGQPLHSWRTLILPYLNRQSPYDSIDLSKPWDDPVNQEAFKAGLGMEYVYTCPSAGDAPGLTTYLAVVTPNSCLRAASSPAMADITDNRSQTVLVIEVDREHAVPWMAPVDADEVLWLKTGPKSEHPNGGNVLCADCSVQFMATSISAAHRRAMVSIAGSDDVTAKSP